MLIAVAFRDAREFSDVFTNASQDNDPCTDVSGDLPKEQRGQYISNDREHDGSPKAKADNANRLPLRGSLLPVHAGCRLCSRIHYKEAGLTDHVWTLEELCNLIPEKKPIQEIDRKLISDALKRIA